MTDQIAPQAIPPVEAILPIVEQQLLAPDAAVAEYHRMGPTYELSLQDAGSLIELSAQTLLTPQTGETVGAMSSRLVSNMNRPELLLGVDPSRRLEATSMLGDTVDALGASAENSSQYKLGNALLSFVESTYKGVIDDTAATPAQKAEALMGLSNVRDQLSRRGVRMTRTELTNSGVTTSTDSEESWRVRSMQGVLHQREHRGENGVKNGVMFEYVVAGLLQFKLWQNEAEDATTYARMARGREDKPAGKFRLDPAIGTMVAHDVVLEVGGERTRIQAKWGSLAEEFGADRYDHTVITEVTDTDITGEQMNTLMRDIIASYKGDEAAIGRVDAYIQSNKDLRAIVVS